ncbi:MAG: GNAT family N-acetyltransferase [Cellvibrionaceae bacterium]|nr:GNAT family N-acetyltransferase [Cellvibrionaceae bacterium]
MDIDIRQIDYRNPSQAQDLVNLLDAYARDPMGGGEGLADPVKQNLAAALAELDHAFSLIAYRADQAVGLVNCFMGFSTFSCEPLVNIHDVVVSAPYRGQGVSTLLLAAVEAIARERGCCKLTLEVLEGNSVAQAAYRNFGFNGYQLNSETGRALFWQKPIKP